MAKVFLSVFISNNNPFDRINSKDVFLSSMKVFLTLLALVLTCQIQAQTTTWSKDVAPILYNSCSSCHHEGGAGHTDLTNYDTAVYNAAAINFYISQKKMPPWPPDITYHRYAQERVLSNAEVATIQNWITSNTTLGDTNLLPPKPVYTGAAILTTPPDHTFQMPTYTVPNNNGDDIYWNFVIPMNNAQEILLSGFEFIPGNSEHVHHSLIYIDTGQAIVNLDNATPGPGYPGFGGAGTNTAQLVGAYVPGSQPFLYPNGFGIRVPPNAYLIFGMHYPNASVGGTDSSKVHLFNTSTTNIREVFLTPLLNHVTNMVNGPLFIPANTTKTFYQNFQIPFDASVFGVAPHMHLIGRSIKDYAVAPNGDTIKLINIPDWDFKWQGMYYFPKLKKLPIGSELWSEAHYDNTSGNPLNPSNPPVNVGLGEATTDEMMLTYFAWTPYQTGDENIILDSNAIALSGPQPYYNELELFTSYPNPASDYVILKWFQKANKESNLQLLNLNGQVVWTKRFNPTKKYNTYRLEVGHLNRGVYIVKLNTTNESLSRKLIIK